MLWANAISDDPDLSTAVAKAADQIQTRLQGQDPDLVVAFLSSPENDPCRRLPDLIASHLGKPLLMGCSAGGVIGAYREIEQGPGLTLTAALLPGVCVEPFYLDGNNASEVSAETAWDETLPVSVADDPVFVLLADPFTTRVEPILESLDRSFPGCAKIGGLASGASRPGESRIFLRHATHDSGLAGIVLSGNLTMETVVAQGCRPIGEPLFVTRADGNLLYEIDGEKPSTVLRALMESSSETDRQLARHSLFLGLAMPGERQRYGQGDYLIRNILGFDPESEAIVVAAQVPVNTVVQFHLRDAAASAAELETLLSDHAAGVQGAPPAGALLFSCLGRGQGLYNEPDHDSRVFRRNIGEVPLGGFFCNGEIGPVQGRTHLHGYTSAFGLFSPRLAYTSDAV